MPEPSPTLRAAAAEYDPPASSQTPAAVTPPPGSEQKPEAAQTPQTFKVKVNGREAIATADELIAHYQKVSAADEYLAKAKETASGNSQKLALAEAILSAKNGDPDGWQKVGKLLNVPDEAIAEALDKASGRSSQPPNRPPAAAPGPVNLENLPENVRKFFSTLEQAGVDPSEYAAKSSAELVKQAKANVSSEVKSDLARDADLRYYVSDDAQSKRIVQLVEDEMRRRYYESGGTIEYGPGLRQSAIQAVRATVEELGIQPRGRKPMFAMSGSSGSLDTGSHQPANAGQRPKMFAGDDKFSEWVTNRLNELALES